MSVYVCKKCGTHKNIGFAVEVIPKSEDAPDDIWEIRVNATCSGCGDWISIDVTSAMVAFFGYFGPDRDEGTLMLD